MGYKVFYTGESGVYHVGGGTLPKTSPVKTYLNFRNGLSMLYKNTYDSTIYYKLPMRVLLDFVAAFKFLFTNSFDNFLSVFKAHVDFIKMYPANRKKKYKNKFLKYSYIEEIYDKSIVAAYFIKKHKTFRELFFLEI